MPNSASDRARLVGINHVAIEVGDLDGALDLYGSIFAFELRGRSESGAFLDVGDQFLAVAEVDEPSGAGAGHRHVGVVVDDPGAVERRLEAVEADGLRVDAPDFRDPWGNWFQVVAYRDVQFTKADHVLRGMGLPSLEKSSSALDELAEKGMAPE